MALSTITAKTKITASTLNTVINAVNAIQTATPKAYITETWISGSSWYRKWNDGWIEQGGDIIQTGHGTVTLHKAYTNTNYTLLGYRGVSTSGSANFEWEEKLTTSFLYDASSVSTFGSWYACRILKLQSKRTQFSEKEIARYERILYRTNFLRRISSRSRLLLQ